MCINFDAHDIADNSADYGVEQENVHLTSEPYVVRPGAEAGAVWVDPESGDRRLDGFSFGMVPSWTKSTEDAKSNRYKFFNARDDRLTESRLWKPRFQNKRCIIPANGFFEPHHYPKEVSQPGGRDPSDSIPFYFTLDGSDHYGFGGIYDEWTNPESGELMRSFSIITTDANQQIELIHNKKPRQPLILSPEDYGFWLNPEARAADYYSENIFTPWPNEDMSYWQVSKALDYGGSGPKQIDPVDNPVPIKTGGGGQKKLFGS